ncbi:MAG: YggT family protein [Magnetococcales bacterium]|nr:YggT family protein [Magnetococcales bacterium]
MGITGSIATLVEFILSLYVWLIVFRVLLSWVNPDPYNPMVQLLMRLTDPVLVPMRRVIPPLGGLDLSPIVALFAVQMVQRFLVTILRGGGSGGMSGLFVELLGAVHLLGTFYLILLFARGGLHVQSWLAFRKGSRANINLSNPIVHFIFRSTEPALLPIRSWVPTVSRLDVSPFVAGMVCWLVLSLLQEIIFGLAMPGMGAVMR